MAAEPLATDAAAPMIAASIAYASWRGIRSRRAVRSCLVVLIWMSSALLLWSGVMVRPQPSLVVAVVVGVSFVALLKTIE